MISKKKKIENELINYLHLKQEIKLNLIQTKEKKKNYFKKNMKIFTNKIQNAKIISYPVPLL